MSQHERPGSHGCSRKGCGLGSIVLCHDELSGWLCLEHKVGTGAFARGQGEYNQDDREADKVWDDVDDYMDQRRRESREKLIKAQHEEMRKRNPKITETFADLKRPLSEMSMDDWDVSLLAFSSVVLQKVRSICEAGLT